MDIESSAIRSTEGKIIEIGAVIVREGEIMDRFHTYIKTIEPLKPWVSKLTGITDEMLAAAPEQLSAQKIMPRC